MEDEAGSTINENYSPSPQDKVYPLDFGHKIVDLVIDQFNDFNYTLEVLKGIGGKILESNPDEATVKLSIMEGKVSSLDKIFGVTVKYKPLAAYACVSGLIPRFNFVTGSNWSGSW